jgi:hypothetical protein
MKRRNGISWTLGLAAAGMIAVSLPVAEAGQNQVAASTLNGGGCPNFQNSNGCVSEASYGTVAVTGHGYQAGGTCGKIPDPSEASGYADCGTIIKIGAADNE